MSMFTVVMMETLLARCSELEPEIRQKYHHHHANYTENGHEEQKFTQFLSWKPWIVLTHQNNFLLSALISHCIKPVETTSWIRIMGNDSEPKITIDSSDLLKSLLHHQNIPIHEIYISAPRALEIVDISDTINHIWVKVRWKMSELFSLLSLGNVERTF